MEGRPQRQTDQPIVASSRPIGKALLGLRILQCADRGSKDGSLSFSRHLPFAGHGGTWHSHAVPNGVRSISCRETINLPRLRRSDAVATAVVTTRSCPRKIAPRTFSKIRLRQERDVHSLITKIKAKLQRSGALKLPSHVRLQSKAIPRQRETPRRHDNKVIAWRHQETVKPGSPNFSYISLDMPLPF
jgi:hypothetical protein